MTAPVLEGKRILIVEDDVTNMAVYQATLKRSGAVVLQDNRNSDTINMLRQFLPIDIILLDLMLRHSINGYDIFDGIKRDPELAHIPVLAVSAADPGIEMPKAKERGFAGFIGKPLNPFEFPQQVAACIAGRGIWHAPTGILEDFA